MGRRKGKKKGWQKNEEECGRDDEKI